MGLPERMEGYLKRKGYLKFQPNRRVCAEHTHAVWAYSPPRAWLRHTPYRQPTLAGFELIKGYLKNKFQVAFTMLGERNYPLGASPPAI
ncbi:hypothetical protein A7P95_03945 [Eikenella longinqua]|uniref:Uncharacterized protein n=1 Tax=Eikenella longinqua TaxID=1795827 RepID=A0A1A9RXB6_9NEIS|nr:hypothetical protein A7P95_03945 [Eikenella longinqua]